MNIFLQIFLYVNVFLIGALFAVGVRHAFAHFRPQEKKARTPDQVPHLPPAVKEKLLQSAEANFEKVLDRSASDLQVDLQKQQKN